MVPKILPITTTEALAIRHTVMWPDKPFDYVRLPNDHEGQHFGLFLDQKLIAVISLFITDSIAQFRKLATLDTYQGQGYGSMLVTKVIEIARQEKVGKLWCNARWDKSRFYTRFGLHKTPNEFKKGGIAYVIMERNF